MDNKQDPRNDIFFAKLIAHKIELLKKDAQNEMITQTSFAMMEAWRKESERYMCDIGEVIEQAIGLAGNMMEVTWNRRHDAIKIEFPKQLYKMNERMEDQDKKIEEMRKSTANEMELLMNDLRRELPVPGQPPPPPKDSVSLAPTGAQQGASPPQVKAPPRSACCKGQQPLPFPKVFSKAPPPRLDSQTKDALPTVDTAPPPSLPGI